MEICFQKKDEPSFAFPIFTKNPVKYHNTVKTYYKKYYVFKACIFSIILHYEIGTTFLKNKCLCNDIDTKN